MESTPAWFHNLQWHRQHTKPLFFGTRETVVTISLQRLQRFIFNLEADLMPRGKASARKQSNFVETEFVSVRLDKEQALAFASWLEQDNESRALDLAEFITAGHKTSITWDDYNSCFIVASTCKDEASDNNNKCITSRSNDWYEAMMLNVYKANVIFDKGAWEADAQTNAWG